MSYADMRSEDLVDRARRALGLSFKEFADGLDVQTSTVTRWRAGSRAMPRAVRLLLHLVLENPGRGAELIREATKQAALEPPEAGGDHEASEAAAPKWDEPTFRYMRREVQALLANRDPSRFASLDTIRRELSDQTPELQDAVFVDLERDGLLVLEPAPEGITVARPVLVEGREPLGIMRRAPRPAAGAVLTEAAVDDELEVSRAVGS